MKKNTIDVLVIVLYHSLKKEANLLLFIFALNINRNRSILFLNS